MMDTNAMDFFMPMENVKQRAVRLALTSLLRLTRMPAYCRADARHKYIPGKRGKKPRMSGNIEKLLAVALRANLGETE